MAAIQVKRAPNGRTLARRMDGQPLTSQDREEARRMAEVQEEGALGIREKETIHPSGAILAAPPCWNCGHPMTEAKTIYGEDVMTCWWCAKRA